MYQEPLNAQVISVHQMQHWEKPTARVLKLNYDGSFISKGEEWRLGISNLG
jgi:hypothetical protein